MDVETRQAFWTAMNAEVAKRISFRLGRADEGILRGLPSLVRLEIPHDLVRIQSADADRTLYALLDVGYRPREIEISSLWFAQGSWMQRIGQAPPTYQITRIGTDLIGKGTVSAASAGIVLAWFAGFVLLAVLAVGRTAETM